VPGGLCTCESKTIRECRCIPELVASFERTDALDARRAAEWAAHEKRARGIKRARAIGRAIGKAIGTEIAEALRGGVTSGR